LGPAIERELKDAEMRREARRIQRELEEREAQLVAAQRLAHVGNWHWDAQEDAAIWSDEMFRIFGRDPSGPAPNGSQFLACLHPDDRETFVTELSSPATRFARDARVVRPDGAIRFVHFRGQILRQANGRPAVLAGMALDVTDQKLTEQQLREARDELEARVGERTHELYRANAELEEARKTADAANESKSLFLANMSHEIRTPMSAILGYADMLLEPGQSDAERIERVQTIRQNANHLLAVLNDILDLSKIEAGKLDVESIPTSTRQIVREVISLMRVRAIEKGIMLDLAFAGPVPQTIRTDPTRLRQVLLNLIGNAIKFTDAGGVHVIVTLGNDAAQTGKPMLELTVIDSGIGMNPDEVQKLFRPFQQADGSTTRKFGGTGLGLTICRRLARMLGGDVTVQSRPGAGSRFVLRVQTGDLAGVPLLHEDGESLTSLTQHAPDPALSIEMRGRILLAEDGIHNQKVLCFYLRKTGLEVTVVENGRQACKAVSQAAGSGQPFDLILMDMQMPEMDGYTAAATLRSQGYRGPIVALTAHAMSHDRSRCLQSGCSDYLTKPIDRKLLLQTIAQHLPKQGPDAPPSPVVAGPAVPLRSEVAADEVEITSLLNGFIADLPHQVSRLLKLSAESDLAGLREVAHQMKGTGGMYGFAPITDAAETLEQQLDTADDIQKVDEEIRRLIGVIRRIEGYDAAQEDRLAPTHQR
jgi:PAS domain S-box-containing protein